MILTDEQIERIYNDAFRDYVLGKDDYVHGWERHQAGRRAVAKATALEVMERLSVRCNGKKHPYHHCVKKDCPDCWNELLKEIEE